MRTVIEQLRAGDAIPATEPKRYKNRAGYVRLRWKVGPYSYVEAYEHRVLTGFVSEEVHHKNRQRDDNRPENLAPLSSIEHGEAHSRIDFAEAAQLYAEGWSLPRLAARYGVTNTTVLRFLKLRGVKMRTLKQAWEVRRRAA